jgi:hypothetical protein
MRNASIAEWILCRITSKKRASSIVGDLVEIGERKGTLWFWLSLCGVVLASVWRQPLAFVAAFYAGGWTFGWFMMANCSIYSLHCATGLWDRAFGTLLFTASTLWALFSYAAIRYGVLDRTAQLSVVWAGLITTVIYFWWQPVVLGLCIAAAFLIVLTSILRSSFRREALALFISIAVGAAVRFLAVIPAGLYQYYLGRHFHIPVWGGPEVREHPSLGWVYIGTVALSLLVATSVWSRMHNWLMRRQRLESEVESQSI